VDRYILVASSFPDFREFLAQAASTALPRAIVIPIESYDQLTQTLPTTPEGSVVVTDIVWDEMDYGNAVITLASAYPRFAWGVASPVDLYGIVSLYYPIPMLSQPQEAETIVNLIRFLAEDLRSLYISGFTLVDFAGQSRLGRCYKGHQPAIHRDVMVTIGSPDPSPEEKGYFLETASAMARISHPSVYSIYESGEENGRSFVAQEPVLAPTLFALQNQRVVFDARLIARLLHTMSGVLQYLKMSGLNYHPIGIHDITLAPNGVVKVINVGCAERLDPVADQEEMIRFANMVIPFIPPNVPNFDPQLLGLLSAMQQGQVDVAQVVGASAAIELKLAPVKEVPKRQQAIEAEKAVKYAKKRFWILTAASTVVFALFAIFFVVRILDFFFPAPGTDFRGQREIPAGKVEIGKKEIDVPKFYMDEYEVTIGQYEKFLKEIKGKDLSKWAPPGTKLEEKDLIPHDWDKVINCIKRKQSYLGANLTKDYPVTGVDFVSAYTYAKWRGKRLPTEAEWIRAAAGNDNFPYPWGKEAELRNANTGVDINPNPATGASAGAVDGYRGPAPVNEMGRDMSPFRVQNMGGNVSEWVVGSPEIAAIKDENQIVKGGNFNQGNLIINQVRFPVAKSFNTVWLGFRCASDGRVD